MRQRAVKRQLNKVLLKRWIEAHQPNAKEKLAIGCGNRFSVAAIDKWFQRDGAPSPINRLKIASFTGIPIDVLFPNVEQKSA